MDKHDAAPSSFRSRVSLDDIRVLTGHGSLAVAPAPPRNVNTLPDLFQHQARVHPQVTALSCQGHNGLQQLTYAQANDIAHKVGHQLSLLHGGRNSRDQAPTVAIWLEKGMNLLLSILSATYSGATWLPFDPDVPVERAAICCSDSAATVVLCDAAHKERADDVASRVEGGKLQVIDFEQLLQRTTGKTAATAAAAELQGPHPGDAAYLIYTSGTTGTPKGIAIPHSAALTFALSERAVLETSTKDVVWNGFSPAFDMFVEEMWVTVAGAGHLAIGTREECRDVAGLPAIWTARNVSIVNAVPTLLGIMGIAQVDGNSQLLPRCVRLINLGGEACPPALVSRLARPGLRIINTYGPTETTVTATWDELTPNAPVTIGRPLPSYHACLLPISEDGNPVSSLPLELSEGVEGELAIGGPCVGLGYVGRPELTAQKFIPHPLALEGCGERMYRTGDRVRLTSDLKIAFLGRIDTQVKHRGFRIELGEIESLLSGHKDVQAAAVILANPNTDNARLEAFVVTAPDAARDAASLNALAAEHLPAYMRPEEIYFLEANEMPRLPSGKINGKALHDVSAQKAAAAAALARETASARRGGDDAAAHSDVDPASPLGMLLAALATVFPSAGRISPTDDFFNDLGGHSLLAAVLVSRLRQAKTDGGEIVFAAIGLPDIYEARTPLAIAARFSASDDEDATVSGEENDGLLAEGTGPSTGEHLPVSQTKFVLCGIAQIVPLLFFFFLNSIEILVPYLLFDAMLQEFKLDVGYAILAAYGVFVTVPVALGILAVVGKWLVLGRAKEGEYPLYGVYYFRWWLADRFSNLANTKVLAESPLYPHFLRAMGAKVGSYTHLGSMAIGCAADLVEIGDDVVVGADVVLMTSVVERGRLILKKVVIEDDAIIGSNSVIEGGATVSEGAEIGALSMVPDGMRVPAFQRFHGSPARFDRDVKEGEAALGKSTRPSGPRAAAMLFGNIVTVVFILPLLFMLPQLPGLMLFDLLDLSFGQWGQVAVLSLPIALAYQVVVFTQLIVFRWLVLGGRLQEGTYRVYSFWYLRKWFVDRIMDLALDVLHPVFATLYIVPFLRALGVKIGRRAEVSTARGLQFELLEIGDESFVADAVLMGDTVIRGNELTLKKTKLEPRAFAGNASLLPQGTTLPTGSLVGVLSIAPPLDKPLQQDTSCFGSPPVLMPARQKEEGTGDASLLFNPSRGRIATRLLIEGLRIVMPRAIIIFGLGFSLDIAYTLYHAIGAVYTLMLLPAFYFVMMALPSMLFTIALKWLLIGDYRKKEKKWPLWSLNVWLSEAVTSTWETIAEPLLASLLVGTPYLAWCFRALGVSIGSRVTLLSSDITEYDLVSLDDESTINQHSGPQTHLFHDRVMQLGTVKLGKRAVMKPYAICLPGSSLSDDAQLGSLSLLMKGENLPEGTAWEGAPTRPRSKRRRAAYGSGATALSTPSSPVPSSSSSTASSDEKKSVGSGGWRVRFDLRSSARRSSSRPSRKMTSLPSSATNTAASSLQALSGK